MKTILFSFFFSFVVNTVFAQYESILGSENTSWDMAVTASGIFADPYLDSCYVANDTIISDLKYSEVRWKYLHYTNPDQAKGYLREDTTSGKAWFLFSQNWGVSDFQVFEEMNCIPSKHSGELRGNIQLNQNLSNFWRYLI